ncbi:uncharacterized protein LOC115036194 [Echeneis naucrates]|uniref:uncharacterized protein LOC115036194 n=1 Tax=Echeneis naucrates TaxID=173247 RepID=UPI0011146817|nr:uncharacterized protein LOC115036194 [Echeneis naucrates]
MKPTNENNAFRRLRMFSGNLPTPAGEESLDHWLEQARLMIEECDCSAREKRKRIVESLKGPALEIIQAVRLNDPDFGPECCIEALESAFGTPESGEDLYFAFRSMYQQPSEKLSDFLRRLERSLTKVVQKGGLLPQRADRARIDQVIRGTTESDIMLLNLRLRERKEKPPTFLKLLSEIREEEEYEIARRKLNTTVRQVKTCEEMTPKATDIQTLKAEVKELRAELGGLRNKQQEASTELKSHSNKKAADSKTDSGEVQMLRQQVQQLQHQLTVLSVSHSSGTADPKHKNGRASRAEKPNATKDSESYFCYRCGGDGHIATRCMAPENHSKVIQKLLSALRKSKEEKGTPKGSAEAKEVVSIRKGSVDTSQLSGLPEGLVGPAQMTTVKIEGQPSRVLLDSGSRVTIIFESWYSQFLSHVPIQPLTNLAIWGLSNDNYPYKGYVAVELELPLKSRGVEEKVSVLALICPDPQSPDPVPVIIGTNCKKLRALQKHCDEIDQGCVHTLRINTLPTEKPPSSLTSSAGVVGQVKWQGPGPLTIPPGGVHYATCKVEQYHPMGKSILMVEADETTGLPNGVLVPPVVLPPSAMDVNGFSLLLRNETEKETTLPSGTVLAQVYLVDSVTELKKNSTHTKSIDPKLFSFGESPIPEAYKTRLATKLAERVNVFSLEEWDVGLAKGVTHSIRLRDPRPFRERSRRIAPGDIEDVRCHLQELLAAGIIQESRSPYASPIVIVRKKNGKVRMCIDYRLLNSRTIPDQYTMPRIDDVLDCLTGSKWFSVLDLRSGYYQVEMAEEDKEKTAFLCPLGFFQFERMPQGITGAPATFQRLMEKAVGDMNLMQVLVYLDDLIVFGKTLEEHEERLLKVLDRAMHDDIGHLGMERTTELIKDRFYWPKMASDIAMYIQNCGREARLPVDLCFGVGSEDVDGLQHHRYVANMREELRKAYQLAVDAASKNHERNKRLYDMRVRNQILEKGDRVLVRNLGITGKHKLQDRWNSLPYVVLAQLPNLPVYRVKPERGTGIVKTMHRDHLLPIGYLVRMSTLPERKAQMSKPVTRAQKASKDSESQTQRSEPLSPEDWNSESEGEEGYYLPQWTLDNCLGTQGLEFEQRDVVVSQDTAVSADSSIHELPAEEDTIVESQEATEQLRECSPSLRDSVVDTELGEGDVPVPSTSAVSVDSSLDFRARREVKPVLRLSYDRLGEPTDRPVTITYKGMVIQISFDT